MAHISLVIDQHQARRDQFVANVQTLFADIPRSTVSVARAEGFSCVWAHGPQAPISLHRSGETFAILIGYAIDDAGTWITAKQLAERWRDCEPAAGVYDGYHVGIVYDPARGLIAAVDPFGMFPLHYATVGTRDQAAVVVSSTPEAVCAHPQYKTSVDRVGLAGVLLCHSPMDERPLLSGVRRLATGHRLQWTPSRGVQQIEAYRLTEAAPPAGETPVETRHRIDHELAQAIQRHRPPHDSSSLLLSGGLDSRLVAAYLTDGGIPTRAIILGQTHDYEVQGARLAAQQLGMPFDIVSTESLDANFPSTVRREVRLNHLSAAPGGDDFAEGLSLVPTVGKYLWSGVPLDWVLDPISSASGRHPVTGQWHFDMMLEYMNRWGVPHHRLAELLGADGKDLVATVIERLRSTCMQGAMPVGAQAAKVRWDQRIKSQVGAALHRTTFFSWPLLPSTDRRLFEAMFGLPVAAYTGRRLEIEILLQRRPDLASIPVDKNSFQFDPLTHQAARLHPWQRWAHTAQKRLRKLYWLRFRRFDPRRYERLFNVDHARWVAVRREVEPLRKRLHAQLDSRALDWALPGPQTRTRYRNPVNQGSAVRLLLSLALWHDRPTHGAVPI